jgi:hypothetical protein
MAAEAISRITGDPATAVSVAIELLADPEFWLVGHAADLLGELGPVAKAAVADLQRLLGHDHEYTRQHVGAAIERILSS